MTSMARPNDATHASGHETDRDQADRGRMILRPNWPLLTLGLLTVLFWAAVAQAVMKAMA